MTTVTPVRRTRRIVGLSAAVAAAATAVVMLTGVSGVAGSAAYAVSKGSDGTVEVQISSFVDPEGLESELAEAGITSVVDYLPAGQTCKQPRGENGAADGRFAASISKAGDGIAFEIKEGEVPADSTLVLAVTKSEDGDSAPPSTTSLQIVKGTVAPCEPTSAPTLPPLDDETGATTDNGPTLNEGTEQEQGVTNSAPATPPLDNETGGTADKQDNGPTLDQGTEQGQGVTDKND
ncbi:hypothetical protein [[Actinomadura] parvosata]|uniref:hypothetical protein n=1 Tax=[Actinomadura] parvosata TaxID=1955412 RepID=UPI0012BD5018|nr:hypothetical protein [Nonomuraea sp. ATCC 55076]